MGYRNVEVDGAVYQYTVGKTHIKVRGLGVWPKEEVGEWFVKRCKCCGESVEEQFDYDPLHPEYTRSLRVLPSHVEAKIRTETRRVISG